LGIILPTDELIFSRGVLNPPTSDVMWKNDDFIALKEEDMVFMRCIVSQLNDPSSIYPLFSMAHCGEHKSPNPQSYRELQPHDHSNRLRWDDQQGGPEIRGTPKK